MPRGIYPRKPKKKVKPPRIEPEPPQIGQVTEIQNASPVELADFLTDVIVLRFDKAESLRFGRLFVEVLSFKVGNGPA